MDYLQDNHMTAYRFAKKSGIPQSTIWSILKKEDYEVREKNIRKICKAMGISASEIMESEEEAKRNLRAGEIPVMHKYRKLDKSDQFRVQGYMDASLKKQDKNSHLAVFGVRRNLISESTWDEIKTAALGNSNIVAEGDPVIALGDTFGYSDGTGYGMISSNAHEKAIPDHTFSVLATDIPSADFSSGVLCNLDGEIIGLIDSEIWTENQGHTANAYGISDLKPIMELLLNSQSVPYAGIYGVTVSSDISESKQVPSGMYVTQIQANSPAMAAGIQSGDVIQSVDGEEIASMAQYEKVLQKCKAGDTIRIQGKRLGAGGYVEISFQLVLDSRE